MTTRNGNIGEEIETVEILPQEAPLRVPEQWPTEAPREPAPLAPVVPVEPEKTPVPV